MDWFINLTQPQATLGAAAFTFFGAIGAVFLGWWLFSEKVKGFQSALSATEQALNSHQASVTQTLSDIEAKISGLAESTGKLSADISDRQAETDDEVISEADASHSSIEPQVASSDSFPALAAAWHRIRDELERRAADPTIDGRTAAKYQRRDRRNYSDLINTMHSDGNLRDHALFLEAAQIWGRFRSRRKAPTPQDVNRLSELALGIKNGEFG